MGDEVAHLLRPLGDAAVDLAGAINGVAAAADQTAAADLLRRSAFAGLTVAQITLASWLLEEFKRKLIEDPREGIEWLEKAYKNGNSLPALQKLLIFYADSATPAPWGDRGKLPELVRLCSGVRDGWCLQEAAWMYRNGNGFNRDSRGVRQLNHAEPGHSY